jgi:beta-lactamase superfamily II metal-dependent hydrolase
MNGSYIALIDVGHGNSTVVRAEQFTLLIDSGPGTAVLSFLTEENIAVVDLILVSHADADHIAGLLAVVTNRPESLRKVRVNSDGIKKSKYWDDLLYELNQLQVAGTIDFDVALTRASNGSFVYGFVDLEVLGPSTYLAGRGPGSADRSGKTITSNSVSAVIRIVVRGNSCVLLPGDLDQVGMASLIESGVDASAPILVFPHHGGSPGEGDVAAFATELMALTRPQNVIFSNGRGKYDLPDPRIVTAIRQSGAQIRIVCTQLAVACANKLPNPAAQTHLARTYSKGKSVNRCCGGTIIIDLDSDEFALTPNRTDHLTFIQLHAPTAMCM